MSPIGTVYVVTRAGRRIEAHNYKLKSVAQERAAQLHQMLKHWDDPDMNKVEVVRTSKPNQIR